MLATPAEAAQHVADRLVGAGVTSILNFAPCVLAVPDGVDVRKVDLAVELQILSFHEHRKSALDRAGPPKRSDSERGGPREPHRRRRVAPHRAVRLLERLSLARRARPRLPGCCPAVRAGGLVVSTCNRVEVYAAVPAFHAGLSDIGEVLAERAGSRHRPRASTLRPPRADAVRHAFRVAAGLDSMVVGEAQILGQFREAYQRPPRPTRPARCCTS